MPLFVIENVFVRMNLASANTNVAGVLMCHEKPDDYLYNSFIQAVFYRGKERDANYQIDAKDFKGPLDQGKGSVSF